MATITDCAVRIRGAIESLKWRLVLDRARWSIGEEKLPLQLQEVETGFACSFISPFRFREIVEEERWISVSLEALFSEQSKVQETLADELDHCFFECYPTISPHFNTETISRTLMEEKDSLNKLCGCFISPQVQLGETWQYLQQVTLQNLVGRDILEDVVRVRELP